MDLTPFWHAVGAIFGPISAQSCLWAALGMIAGMILMAGRERPARPRSEPREHAGRFARFK